MKRNIRNNILGLLTAAFMLGVTSCKDDTFANFAEQAGDEVKVSFSLSPEGANANTRATSGTRKISDGSKADILIYAVYDEDGNLLDQYGLGSFDETKFPSGTGQTILKPENGFPMDIDINLKRGETYQIAFWAMSSKAKDAYKTANLKKVEVNYSQVTDDASAASADDSSSTPNNDEFRDAFCRSITLTAGQNGAVQQHVHLFRPLAQINVGTSGFDYEIATRETQTKYTFSKIRINRVARYLDVVEDRTYTSTTEAGTDKPEAFAVVDFGWAPLPAYANMYDNDDDPYKVNIPEYPSYSKWDWIYNPQFKLERDGQAIDKTKAVGEDGMGGIYGKEYFLNVHRNFDADATEVMPSVDDQDNDGDRYRDYASLTGHYNKDSETFKYLSMCYVLTASDEKDPYVINNVKVWLATDKNGANEYELLNINQVPVQKNWRTNIIGNLMTEENNFEVKLDTDFAGEFSGWGPNWQWTGPIAPGVFYNGEEDVIEISSKEGLVWLQKMVNGDLVVREAKNEGDIGGNYWYYDSNNKSTEFKYGKLAKPSDSELVERIMVATHQKYNENSSWPAANNFHFTGKKDGVDYPATVRLMADIDLNGEEWIPIGFEGRIGEQLGWSVIPHDKDSYTATDDNVSNRIFYGIFDGNGHTIYNLTTKRFSANVHEKAQQSKGYRKIYNGTDSRHPSDNPQWFGRGLFGQIGGNAKITNVRLNNVDIYGCNGVAGVVGIAYGDAIEISNCIVDGGSIISTPMYRGDSYRDARTFARGVYMGGIVGYFNTNGGKVDNNIVRNVYMQAVRRAGGIIGSINQKWMDSQQTVKDEGQGLVDGTWKSQRESKPASISGNQLNNVVLVISSFTSYGERMNFNNKYNTNNQSDLNDNIARAGFGYNNGNLEMYSQKFVGGYDLDADQRADLKDIFKGNTENGVTFAHLPIIYPDKQTRRGTIEGLPLVHMPMLSSWYADYIDLKDNYYGEPSARTDVQLHDFQFWSQMAKKSGYTNDQTNFNSSGTIKNGGTNFYFPMNLPFEVDIDYIEDSPKAGVFVESVTLDGKGGIGGRSVITPIKVNQDENDCVMYITARNRHQFGSDKYLQAYMPEFMKGFEALAVNTQTNKIPTIVKNVVLRGEPYANNGILLAPNKNLHRVELHNVAIYDVYKTLALYKWEDVKSQLRWPNSNEAYDALTRNDNYATPAKPENLPFMILNDCNLRGYTVPGGLWSSIDYNNTTFERGASTGHGDDEFTCLVETATTFNKCFFKAPYIIDMTKLPSDKAVAFKDCAASAATIENVAIKLEGKTGCNKIMIKAEQGKPYVEYYKGEELIATDKL